MGVVSASVLLAEKIGCIKVTEVGQEAAVIADAGIGAYVVGAAIGNALKWHGGLTMAESNNDKDQTS